MLIQNTLSGKQELHIYTLSILNGVGKKLHRDWSHPLLSPIPPTYINPYFWYQTWYSKDLISCVSCV